MKTESELFSFPLSIPVENFEDHSAPPSPDEKDSGFFMLRKDSERRATLHHILTEDRDKVVANLMEAITQVGYGRSHQSDRQIKKDTSNIKAIIPHMHLNLSCCGFYPDLTLSHPPPGL